MNMKNIELINDTTLELFKETYEKINNVLSMKVKPYENFEYDLYIIAQLIFKKIIYDDYMNEKTKDRVKNITIESFVHNSLDDFPPDLRKQKSFVALFFTMKKYKDNDKEWPNYNLWLIKELEKNKLLMKKEERELLTIAFSLSRYWFTYEVEKIETLDEIVMRKSQGELKNSKKIEYYKLLAQCVNLFKLIDKMNKKKK